MDNNYKNVFASSITGMMIHADAFIKCAQTGEGMGLSDEQKEKFNEGMKSQGGFEKIEELKNTLAKFKETIKKTNTHGAANTTQQ